MEERLSPDRFADRDLPRQSHSCGISISNILIRWAWGIRGTDVHRDN